MPPAGGDEERPARRNARDVAARGRQREARVRVRRVVIRRVCFITTFIIFIISTPRRQRRLWGENAIRFGGNGGCGGGGIASPSPPPTPPSESVVVLRVHRRLDRELVAAARIAGAPQGATIRG